VIREERGKRLREDVVRKERGKLGK